MYYQRNNIEAEVNETGNISENSDLSHRHYKIYYDCISIIASAALMIGMFVSLLSVAVLPWERSEAYDPSVKVNATLLKIGNNYIYQYGDLICTPEDNDSLAGKASGTIIPIYVSPNLAKCSEHKDDSKALYIFFLVFICVITPTLSSISWCNRPKCRSYAEHNHSHTYLCTGIIIVLLFVGFMETMTILISIWCQNMCPNNQVTATLIKIHDWYIFRHDSKGCVAPRDDSLVGKANGTEISIYVSEDLDFCSYPERGTNVCFLWILIPHLLFAGIVFSVFCRLLYLSKRPHTNSLC